MASRWPGLGAAVLLLLRAGTAGAHAEHLPEKFVIQAYVKRDGAQVELLLRTPLVLFTNVGLPLQGRSAIDIAAFQSDDPHAEGEVSYARRAANAVKSAVALHAGDRPIPLTARHIQLARHDNKAFASYESARAHVAAGWPGPELRIDHRRGFVDVLFRGKAPAGAPLAFAPTISPALAGRTTFRVTRAGAAGAGAHPLEIPGTADPVPLAP